MDAFAISDLMARQKQSNRPYLEFLRPRSASLSAGIYALPAGGADPQQPHRQDEVYYVVSGRGMIHVGADDRPVQPGTVVFVAEGVEHRFHSIADDLTLLVFFAPAET